jgi:hypothetical protein
MSATLTTLPTNVTYAARARIVRRQRAKPHRQRMVEALEAFLDWLDDARQFAVERLDELHGDPDLEPDLAGYNIDRINDDYTAYLGNDDREADDDIEQDTVADSEPSLGAPEDGAGGCRWGGQHMHVTGEEEASLGSLGAIDQRRWSEGSEFADALELEDACEDEGADTDREEDRADEEPSLGWRTWAPDWPPINTMMMRGNDDAEM